MGTPQFCFWPLYFLLFLHSLLEFGSLSASVIRKTRELTHQISSELQSGYCLIKSVLSFGKVQSYYALLLIYLLHLHF